MQQVISNLKNENLNHFSCSAHVLYQPNPCCSNMVCLTITLPLSSSYSIISTLSYAIIILNDLMKLCYIIFLGERIYYFTEYNRINCAFDS